MHASNVTADLDSETSQQASMLASTLTAAPEFTASQPFGNIMPFGRCRALVLDSSYRPIDVVNWQRAICLDLFDKVQMRFPSFTLSLQKPPPVCSSKHLPSSYATAPEDSLVNIALQQCCHAAGRHCNSDTIRQLQIGHLLPLQAHSSSLRAGNINYLPSMQVDVLEYYETSVRSASAQFLIPAVLRVRMYVSKRELKSGRLSLSRRNILLRDSGQCQCVSTPPSEVSQLMLLKTSPWSCEMLT